MKITEDNFITQLKKKNEKALHYVVEEYGWLIQTVVRKHLASIPNYEDECINDVLLAVWTHIENYHPDESSFSNWLAGIARYKAIDYKRKYMITSLQQIFEDSDYVMPDNTLDRLLAKEMQEEVRAMLSCLSSEDQQIFKRHFFEEVEIDEIAKEMGLKRSAIYNRISRGRKKLRARRLGKQVGEDGRFL